MKTLEATRLIAKASKLTESIFRDCGGIIMPIVHFKGDSGETVMGVPSSGDIDDEDSKDFGAMAIRKVLAADNAEWVLIITEAWALSLPHNAPYIRPADHPDRVEVVIYQFEDKDLGTISAKQDIIRVDGQRPRLGELKMDPPTKEASGRLVGLLPKGKMSS